MKILRSQKPNSILVTLLFDPLFVRDDITYIMWRLTWLYVKTRSRFDRFWSRDTSKTYEHPVLPQCLFVDVCIVTPPPEGAFSIVAAWSNCCFEDYLLICLDNDCIACRRRKWYSMKHASYYYHLFLGRYNHVMVNLVSSKGPAHCVNRLHFKETLFLVILSLDLKSRFRWH